MQNLEGKTALGLDANIGALICVVVRAGIAGYRVRLADFIHSCGIQGV